MRERIIMVAWEFPGYNTNAGKALSKRIGVLAEGLSQSYEVIVISRNHFNSKIEKKGESFPVYLIPGFSNTPKIKLSIIRKIWTFFCVLLVGDQSGLWGIKASYFIKQNLRPSKIDRVISFYTPRGPVLCGYLINLFYGSRLILDFQDPFSDGLNKWLLPIGRMWFRKIVKRSSLCIHVSPEWSGRHSKELGKHFYTIRHSLPNLKQVESIRRNKNMTRINLLFYGSFVIDNHFHQFFFEVIQKSKDFAFKYAGHEQCHRYFLQKGLGENYTYLGWLEEEGLSKVIDEIDFLIIFGNKRKDRLLVPSKLYEYISRGVPIVIFGEDSGGICSLEEEFNYRFNWIRNSMEFNMENLSFMLAQKPDYSAFESLSQTNFIRKYMDVIGSL